MNKEVVIKVENVSKKFSKSLRRGLAYGTYDLFRNLLGLRSYDKRLRKGEFWSLDNINFEIYKGETFGLVGANGSGKSTLLRLLNGIFPPDKGKIMVKGRMGALIAVGAGFHPYMTGRENIYLNGTILGMTKKEIEERFEDIIDFAEIGEFIDAPVSTYSSGMYVRLGFAIAIHSNPDIVLLDEILSVGDAKFQRKCLDKIKEMRGSGVTFILVSHNMQNILYMCNRALLIDHGKQIMCDVPAKVVPEYELILQSENQPDIANSSIDNVNQDEEGLQRVFKYLDFGTDEIEVNKVLLLDKNNKLSKEFDSDESFKIEMHINSLMDLSDSILSATFVYINDFDSDENNFTPLGQNFVIERISKGESIVTISFPRIQLTTGVYKIALHFFDSTFTNPYSQGMYGFFNIKKNIPTMANAGKGTPLCWSDAEISVISQNNN